MNAIQFEGIYVRAHRAEQDVTVIREVIHADCYQLRQMKQAGYEPKTIVSIGSHIGTFELLAHSLWPEAHLVSVEPNRESFALLEMNVGHYASLHNVAVSYIEDAILIDGAHSTGGCTITTKEEFATKKWRDPVTIIDKPICLTFDELMKRENLSHIDLLKLDCEGGEKDILRTWSQRTTVDWLVGEYHDMSFEDFKKLAEEVLPHLEIYGGNGGDIGPFYSFPQLTKTS
jgi:FkbM family methyltransferase